jgi:hypothetical protein
MVLRGEPNLGVAERSPLLLNGSFLEGRMGGRCIMNQGPKATANFADQLEQVSGQDPNPDRDTLRWTHGWGQDSHL